MISKHFLFILLVSTVIFKHNYAYGQERNMEKESFSSQFFPLITIIDTDYFIKGHISNQNGMLIASPSNYMSTDFINVWDCDVIECNLPPSKGGGVAFYDKNKRYLSALSLDDGGFLKVKMPQRTSFIRLCKRTDLSGITYYAKLFKSDYRNKNETLQEQTDLLQHLNMGLYAALTPNYTPVFQQGDFTYNAIDKNGIAFIDSNIKEYYQPVFRIPVHLKTKHGTIIVTAEAIRKQKGIEGKSVVLARSTNKGKSFEKHYICEGDNQCLIYDERYDRIFLLHGLAYSISMDDGQTWSEFKPMNINKPKGWERIYPSPTTGIQLSNGILAAPYILMNGAGKRITQNANAVVYSTDFGETWNITATTPISIIANETTIAEYTPNQIMINARGGTEVHWNSENPGRRVFVPATISQNDRNDWNIEKWVLHESDKQLIEPICNASFVACKYGKYRFGLFCNPYTKEKVRKNLILQVSYDFSHWSKVGLLTPYDRELYGYCSLNYQNKNLSFVFEDIECGILYADLSLYMDEILAKMIVNKLVNE